jgi:hypothetical protein
MTTAFIVGVADCAVEALNEAKAVTNAAVNVSSLPIRLTCN